ELGHRLTGELLAFLMGALEMQAQHLGLVAGGIAELLFQPVGVALMEIGARLAEEAAIRSVPDEHVVEAEQRLVARVRSLGLDELAAAQRLEMAIELVDDGRRHDRRDPTSRELWSDD